MTTLADLLAPTTADGIKQQLIASLQGRGFPTTDWTSTSIERALVEMESTAVYDLAGSLVPSIAAGGLLLEALARGLSGWITLIAKQSYGLDRILASKTVGHIKLTCASTAGPYTITGGQLRAQGTSGNTYVNTTGGTLATSGTLTLTWEAEAPGASYNDPNDTITRLLTPLPGVTINNPTPTPPYTEVIHTGSSPGTLTPSGATPSPGSYQIRIDSSGQAGVASWSYKINAGAWVSVGAVASAAIGASGITVTLANGAYSPSFVADDIWTFSSPGSWITTQGRDDEEDAVLVSRCLARWPSLAAIPLDDKYALWARSPDATPNNPVTKVAVSADPALAATVNITVATDLGDTAASVVNAIQAFITSRAGLTDLPVVASATAVDLALTGATVYVTATQLVQAQAAAQAAIQAYIKAAPIGGYKGLGLPPQYGMISWSEILGMLTSAPGVKNVQWAAFDIGSGSGPVNDIILLATEVARYSQDIATAVTWVAI